VRISDEITNEDLEYFINDRRGQFVDKRWPLAVRDAREQLKIAKEALAFYAERRSYHFNIPVGNVEDPSYRSAILTDVGEIARRALEKLKCVSIRPGLEKR
jgi:hypothetical protein